MVNESNDDATPLLKSFYHEPSSNWTENIKFQPDKKEKIR